MSDENKILILLSILFVLIVTFFFLAPLIPNDVQENGDVQDVKTEEDIPPFTGIVKVLENPNEICEQMCVYRNDDMKKVDNEDGIYYCTCLSGYKRLIGNAPSN